MRLDQALVARGLARSRGRATELIRDGVVRLDGVPATRAAMPVGDGQQLSVAVADHYVSRAAYKLLGALTDCGLPGTAIAGRTCLDAGASTGGFTQVLLERGAAVVHAVDVGHDQLHPDLRGDPRVRVLERTNLRELTAAQIDPPAELVVADVSFISLRLVLGPLTAVSTPSAWSLLMVKPQFEVGRERLGKGGVVRDPRLHEQAVAEVVAAAAALGWSHRSTAPSRLPGPAGNREFFVLLGRGDPGEPPSPGR